MSNPARLDELLDGARRQASRAHPRQRMRRGGRRLRDAAWTIGQCALGAIVAWLIAKRLVHHGTPVFAPIAAVVCLGLSYGARLRRVVELAVGVSIGVGLADLLVRWIGTGAWQIGLVVVVGMGVAVFGGGGTLIVNQAALQAIFLIALPQPSGGGLARWEDALIGSAVALVVAAAAPPDPARAVRPQARQLVRELAGVIDASAQAIVRRDAALADATLERARGTHVDIERLTEALRSGEEITRLSPLYRARREEMQRFRRTLIGVDRAARNMRVAVRRVASVLDQGEELPRALGTTLADLAAILHELGRHVGTSAIDLPVAQRSAADPPDPGSVPGSLIALAARLDPVELGAHTLSAQVVVGQIRSAVVDLLEITGMDGAAARRLLGHADGGPEYT